MPTWDPSLYLQFGDQRLRPAVDLLSRIPLESPGAVYDLGCGTGTATVMLKQRWPEARVTGLDGSDAMLERAREAEAQIDWQ
jgi:trans-aconitate 2-methyltransferase